MTSKPTATRPGSVLAMIGAGHFMSHFYMLVLPPLFPVLTSRFGVHYFELAVLISVYSVANAICQIPFGVLVDRHGPKLVLAGGLLLNGGAFALAAIAPNYAALLVLMALAGVGQAVFHPSDYSILSALWSNERAGKPYSIHTFTGFAGSAVAPIVVAALNGAFGWRAAVAVPGLVGIAIAAVVVLRLHVPMAEVAPAPAEAPRPSRANRFAFFFSQAFLLLFAFFVSTSMFSSGLQSFLPSTLTELYDLPNALANGVLTAFLAAVATGVLIGGFVADRVRNYGRLISVTFTVGMLLMFVIALTRPPVWLLFALFALSGAVQGVIMPSRDKMVREASPAGATASSFAFVSVGFSVGGIIGPLILGPALDHNAPGLVLWALAIFLLLATATVVVPSRASRAHAPEPAEERVSA